MGHHQLDALDEQILKLIAGNARIPFLEVARACNVSGAAIHQRIQKLTNLGILKGSEYVIDPEKIGYETCAYIGNKSFRSYPRSGGMSFHYRKIRYVYQNLRKE